MVSLPIEADATINSPLAFKCFLKGKVLFHSEIIISHFFLLAFIRHYLNPPLYPMFQDSIISPNYIPEQKEPYIFHVFCSLEKVRFYFRNIFVL